MGKRLTSPRPSEAMPAPIEAADTTTASETTEQRSADVKSHTLAVPETTSDNERPVREKLKKTSIAGMSKDGVPIRDTTETGDATEPQVSQALEDEENPSHKAEEAPAESIEDDGSNSAADDTPRTPEAATAEDADVSQFSPTSPALASDAGEYRRPERKRSRDQFDNDEADDGSDASNPSRPASKMEKEHPDKKKKRDGTVEAKEDLPTEIKIDAAGSAFLNPPKRSGFAVLGEKAATESVFRSPQKEGTASAFSGFGGASSTASPFSSRLAPEPMSISPFASPAKGSTSAFGSFGSGGPISGFGSSTSAFGSSLGSGSNPFSSAIGTSGPSVFGSGSAGITGLTGKPAKPFGAPESEPNSEEEEGSDEENDGDGEDLANGDKPKAKDDSKFHQQKPETGEDGERTEFSCRAKMFQFKDKQWKERGVGTVKLKVMDPRKDDEESATAPEATEGSGKENKRTARILMRADGIYRVILNTPIFKGFIIGDEHGKEPKGKHVRLTSIEDGKAMPLLLRISREDDALELYERVMNVAESL